MSIHDRAAQFSPFAALTGYGDAVEETARLTSQKKILDETEREALDRQLASLAGLLEESRKADGRRGRVPGVRITYFLPDQKKSGGAYLKQCGAVTDLDWLRGEIVMEDGTDVYKRQGLICAAVQLLLDRTKLMPGRIMVSLVVTGAVLGFLGIYEPFAQWAGAGATVPLTGFGNTLWKGIARAMGEDGILGIFKGGFTASAVGISGALVFGYLGSLVFKPKMKG